MSPLDRAGARGVRDGVSVAVRRRGAVHGGSRSAWRSSRAPGTAWAAAGHAIVVGGRSPDRARAAATQIGPAATAIDPSDLAGQADVIVIAIAWDGLENALALVGGPNAALSGKSVVDCTNPVVAICGDDAGALRVVGALIADLNARTAVLGGLAAARQAEETAAFVMRVVAAGANPRFAVPDVQPALLAR